MYNTSKISDARQKTAQYQDAIKRRLMKSQVPTPPKPSKPKKAADTAKPSTGGY